MTVHKLVFNLFKHRMKQWINCDPNRTVSVQIPFGSTILSAANQDELICVWYIPGPSTVQEAMIVVKFLFLEPGMVCEKYTPNQLDYIGAVMFESGQHVVHAFKVRH
jgi:hypothetical protein